MIRLCEHPVYGKYFKWLLKEGRSNADCEGNDEAGWTGPEGIRIERFDKQILDLDPNSDWSIEDRARRVREPSGGQFRKKFHWHAVSFSDVKVDMSVMSEE